MTKTDELFEDWRHFLDNKKIILENAQPRVEKDSDTAKTIAIPKFRITEKWGEPGSDDRVVLESFSAKIKGSTLKQKLQSISKFVTRCDKDCRTNQSIPEILGHLVFLDALSSIVFEFNASTAGFLFESFLAALMGGSAQQIPTEGSESNVVDITTARGIPVSLKLLKKGGEVKGSIDNLKADLDELNRNMDYVVAYKTKETTNGIVLEIGRFSIGYRENDPTVPIELLEEDPRYYKKAKGEKKQFVISGGDAIATARGDPLGEFELPNREYIKKIAERYAGALTKEIVEIYNLLESLSGNINGYLLNSPESKRAGLQATKNVKNLAANINNLVKT